MQKVNLSVRIPKELDSQLSEICNRLGISKNAFVIIAIAEALKKEKKGAYHREQVYTDSQSNLV